MGLIGGCWCLVLLSVCGVLFVTFRHVESRCGVQPLSHPKNYETRHIVYVPINTDGERNGSDVGRKSQPAVNAATVNAGVVHPAQESQMLGRHNKNDMYYLFKTLENPIFKLGAYGVRDRDLTVTVLRFRTTPSKNPLLNGVSVPYAKITAS